MTKNKYPELNFEIVFDIYNIGQAMKRDPAYIEESPYPEMVRKTLKRIFFPTDTGGIQPIRPEIINTADLDIKRETEYLYLETKQLLQSKTVDEKDRAAIIKTATSQMEKLITLIEKANDLRNRQEFETKVLKVLKKVLPEKKEEFLEELAHMEGKDGSKS